MHPSEPGLRVAVGVSGSGKTHGNKRESFAAATQIAVIALDPMHEFNAVPEFLSALAAPAADIESAARLIRDNGKRYVIVRPADFVTSAAQAAEWARQYGRSIGTAGLVIPEAHHVAPVTGPVPIELDRIATQWRHHNVALWCDTQRIARIHHSITDNARELRIYAQFGETDMRRVREIGGQDLVTAVHACAKKFAPVDEGGENEPGWHVKLGVWRQGPYTPIRSAA